MIEKTRTGYAGYVLEVPGCVSSGKTVSEVATGICEALRAHFNQNPQAIPLTFRTLEGGFTVESSYPASLH